MPMLGVPNSSTGLRNIGTFAAKKRSKVANITPRGELGVNIIRKKGVCNEKITIMERVRKNFPNKSAEEVFTEIGGKVKLNYDIGVFKNACATRISKALNFSLSGHEIPYFKTKDSDGNDVVQVSSGGKKLWYIYRVKALIQYLTKTYGEPRPIDITKYEQELKGKKGIIVFEIKGWDDATGHADLWDGGEVLRDDYGYKAHKIIFWESF